jgi:hypothetical protein
MDLGLGFWLKWQSALLASLKLLSSNPSTANQYPNKTSSLVKQVWETFDQKRINLFFSFLELYATYMCVCLQTCFYCIISYRLQQEWFQVQATEYLVSLFLK